MKSNSIKINNIVNNNKKYLSVNNNYSKNLILGSSFNKNRKDYFQNNSFNKFSQEIKVSHIFWNSKGSAINKNSDIITNLVTTKESKSENIFLTKITKKVIRLIRN